MAGLSAKYKEDADLIFEEIEKICNTHEFKISNKDAVNRRLILSIKASWFSWGETIEIIVSQQKDGSVVTINSKPKAGFNVTAYSKADKEAQEILDEINKIFKSTN